jgi:hypothetical protein
VSLVFFGDPDIAEMKQLPTTLGGYSIVNSFRSALHQDHRIFRTHMPYGALEEGAVTL